MCDTMLFGKVIPDYSRINLPIFSWENLHDVWLKMQFKKKLERAILKLGVFISYLFTNLLNYYSVTCLPNDV